MENLDYEERQRRYHMYRLHYPYAMIVRQSDGSIMFINRDYAPLQKKYVHVPMKTVQKIAEMGDMNGSQMQGFETHWFYDDGNAPSNNIGRAAEKMFMRRMRRMGTLLSEYGYAGDMFFVSPGKRGDEYYISEEEEASDRMALPDRMDSSECPQAPECPQTPLIEEIHRYLMTSVIVPTDATAIVHLARHLFRKDEHLYKKAEDLLNKWNDNHRRRSTKETDLQFVPQPALQEGVQALLTEYWEGKTKPREIMRPLRAALDAGVISKPTYKEFERCFHESENVSQTAYNKYMNSACTENSHPFRGDAAFDVIKKKFEELLKEADCSKRVTKGS